MLSGLNYQFLLAYRRFRNEFEDAARSDTFRRDLLGLWMAGGEL